MSFNELLIRIANILRDLPAGSIERENAITDLRNIARILAQRELSLA